MKVKTTQPTSSPFLSEKKIKVINEGISEKDNDKVSLYPTPKVVDTIFKKKILHPNKAAGILIGDNEKYPDNSSIALVAGMHGSVVTDVDPTSGLESIYSKVNELDSSYLVINSLDDPKLTSTAGPMNARSSIRALSDTVSIHGREVVEIVAGGRPYRGPTGSRIFSPGEVHIVAGNTVKEPGFDLQPMVKGDNLVSALDDIMTLVNSMASNQTKIHNEIVLLKLALAAHTHPIGAPTTFPSPELASAIAGLAMKDITSMTNNFGSIVNNELFKLNYLKPFSERNIKSRYNKVN